MRFIASASAAGLAAFATLASAHPLDSPADAADAPLNRRALNDIIANATDAAPAPSLLERAAGWIPSLLTGDSVIEERGENNVLEERQNERTKILPGQTKIANAKQSNRRTKTPPGATPYNPAATTFILPQSSSSSTPAPQPTTPVTPPTTSNFNKVQDWTGTNFFNGWEWFTYADPTHGQVNFVNWDVAFQQQLAYFTQTGSAVMRVDSTTWLPQGANRNSIRLASKQAVEIGSLVLFDANKLPYGPTVWPAFWMVGTDWPNNGEIDIVEGVHNQPNNYMTLHTKPGCYLATPMQASGQVSTTTCDANVNSNVGCSVHDNAPNTYGAGFNSVGGGVFATLFTVDFIAMWHFPRNAIPSDISSDNPNPDNWGTPNAKFDKSACDIQNMFGPQTMVFDITICGDWAGPTYNQAGFSGSCSSAVANPNNYVNAVFDVNYVRVYKAK